MLDIRYITVYPKDAHMPVWGMDRIVLHGLEIVIIVHILCLHYSEVLFAIKAKLLTSVEQKVKHLTDLRNTCWILYAETVSMVLSVL